MTDFRNLLYDRYVSAFKTENLQIDPKAKRQLWSYWEKVYLPLLSELNRNATILELGCGPGLLLQFMTEHGFENVKGIDLAQEQIEIASRKNLDVAVADVADYLTAVSGKFDAIIAIDFLEHFSRDELIDLVAMIHGALKPGGLFISQTPNGQGLFSGQIIYGDLTHMTILNPNSLEQLVRICGFNRVDFFESTRIESGARGVIRRLLWYAIKLILNAVRRIEAGKTQKIWSDNMICLARRAAD